MQGSNSVSQLQGSTLYNTINHNSGKISNIRINLSSIGDLLGERSAYNFDASTSNLLKLVEINPKNAVKFNIND